MYSCAVNVDQTEKVSTRRNLAEGTDPRLNVAGLPPGPVTLMSYTATISACAGIRRRKRRKKTSGPGVGCDTVATSTHPARAATLRPMHSPWPFLTMVNPALVHRSRIKSMETVTHGRPSSNRAAPDPPSRDRTPRHRTNILEGSGRRKEPW